MAEQKNSLRIVAHGMLGYGFPKASLDEAVRRGIDLIAVDSGSTDPGPYYLGSGRPFVSDTMVERDLRLLLQAADESGALLVIGSAGGAGTRSQLQHIYALVESVVQELGTTKRIAVIDSEIDPNQLKADLLAGRVRTFESGRDLTEKDIDEAQHIVAQIGLEPMMSALRHEPDIILAGRAWDVANVAAYPVYRGLPWGPSLHMGKILECGGQAAVPVEGSDLLIAEIDHDGFTVETPNPGKRCTVESIAAHTLYEKINPVRLPGPGGVVNLESAHFTQEDEGRVRVMGSRFERTPDYFIKLEGARLTGHRHIALGGVRDPIMIENIDAIQNDILERIRQNTAGDIDTQSYQIVFHRYGIDGVMGRWEPSRSTSHEIGLLIDVIAKTPEIAESICAMARSLMLHWGYAGRKATAGNLAFPFSPADLPAGPVYEFNIYHLLKLDEPSDRFPISIREV
ncbi:acyclic terpene utilization AtuA family protein [Aquibaculum sediminis]|uniref:acyclic terpene utilization AtuA family protein n=1 Tax=Aquibaculum sediminis TaxID=3231907 RepID=UPI003451AEF7